MHQRDAAISKASEATKASIFVQLTARGCLDIDRKADSMVDNRIRRPVGANRFDFGFWIFLVDLFAVGDIGD